MSAKLRPPMEKSHHLSLVNTFSSVVLGAVAVSKFCACLAAPTEQRVGHFPVK